MKQFPPLMVLNSTTCWLFPIKLCEITRSVNWWTTPLFNKPINERNLCHKKWSYLLDSKGFKPEMSGIFVGRDCCNCFVLLFVFFFSLFFLPTVSSTLYPIGMLVIYLAGDSRLSGLSAGCQVKPHRRTQYSWWSSLRYFEAVKCTEGWHLAVFHWCHSCANFIDYFSENIFHPGIIIAIIENKAKQYKFYIPKLEL